jgi:hypothetical protein
MRSIRAHNQTAVTSFIMMYITLVAQAVDSEHCTQHLLMHHSQRSSSISRNVRIHLTLASALHRTILANMDVQPVGLVVHRLHASGLEDAVLLGEVGLCEGLLERCISGELMRP